MDYLRLFWPEWRFVEKLEAGQNAEVYKIEKTREGYTEYNVIKIISFPNDDSVIANLRRIGISDFHEYFQQCADHVLERMNSIRTLADNPYIAPYKECKKVKHSYDDGYDIILRMDYLTPLSTYQKSKSLNTKEIIEIGRDISKALWLCENNNIVHLNIKPSNIFVSRNKVFSLGDFGIYDILNDSLKTDKTISYNYMAPEVYMNQFYDSKADLYSLGIVLYQLLNNGLPFSFTESSEQALKKRLLGEPILPSINVSNRINMIVCKACNYRVEERYQNALELYQDICHLIQEDKDLTIYDKTEREYGVYGNNIRLPKVPIRDKDNGRVKEYYKDFEKTEYDEYAGKEKKDSELSTDSRQEYYTKNTNQGVVVVTFELPDGVIYSQKTYQIGEPIIRPDDSKIKGFKRWEPEFRLEATANQPIVYRAIVEPTSGTIIEKERTITIVVCVVFALLVMMLFASSGSNSYKERVNEYTGNEIVTNSQKAKITVNPDTLYMEQGDTETVSIIIDRYDPGKYCLNANYNGDEVYIDWMETDNYYEDKLSITLIDDSYSYSNVDIQLIEEETEEIIQEVTIDIYID